ncbi:hypothetical protein EDB86DRAFT_1064187 [Lactarius hatsudake]|nr:hypothetical protein EDB86DRAFT_1064187 [Lactarius hatsudake]
MAATHELDSRGQPSSVGSRRTEPRQRLTSWTAEDSRRQQARNAPIHGGHAHTGQPWTPRIAVVSRLETHRAAAATHFLDSRRQPPSLGSKCTEPRQLLTVPGQPRTAVVSRLETHQAKAATHSLDSRGQPPSVGSKRTDPRRPLTLWTAQNSRRQ